MSGAICGGVISESMLLKGMKKDIYFGMMAFVMPDKHYNRFILYKKQGKEKEANNIFKKYALSHI